MGYIYGRVGKVCRNCSVVMTHEPVEITDMVCGKHFVTHMPGYLCRACDLAMYDTAVHYFTRLLICKGLLVHKVYTPCTLKLVRQATMMPTALLAKRLDVPLRILDEHLDLNRVHALTKTHFTIVEDIIDDFLWRDILGPTPKGPVNML